MGEKKEKAEEEKKEKAEEEKKEKAADEKKAKAKDEKKEKAKDEKKEKAPVEKKGHSSENVTETGGDVELVQAVGGGMLSSVEEELDSMKEKVERLVGGSSEKDGKKGEKKEELLERESKAVSIEKDIGAIKKGIQEYSGSEDK